MAHINEHPKFRSGANTAVAAVRRGRVLSAHWLQGRAGKRHSQCDNSEKGNLFDDHDHNCAGAAASRPNRRFVETPRSLCTCFLALYKTKMTRRSHKRTSNGRNVRKDWRPVLACQFAWLSVVGGYKSKGVCDQRFAVFHATLSHIDDALGDDLAHGT